MPAKDTQHFEPGWDSAPVDRARAVRGGVALVETASLWLMRLAQLLLLAMTGAMLAEVGCRYLFNAPTVWAYDVSYMVNGALFMLAAAYGLSKDGHVRVDALSQFLPLRLQRGVNLAFYLLLFLPALAFLGWTATSKALHAIATGELEQMSAWGPPVAPFYVVLTLGILALALQTLAESAKLLGSLLHRDWAPATDHAAPGGGHHGP